jgi:3-isopropylmalate/(R)-2-methylmalate dehydratase small subunit
MQARGKSFVFGDNIDTDVIIPARYLNTSDEKELAKYCMIDIDDTFAKRVQNGDIIVAKKNFGCGSSREHAPIAIKASGVSCVIAESFARIFYRNAINIGLPILECPSAVSEINEGDVLSVNFDTGVIVNETTNKQYQAKPFPVFIQNIINAGGLLRSLKEETSDV